MKILLVVPSLGNGGAEKHAQRLANELVNMGHAVTIAPFRAGGSYEKDLSSSVHLVPLSKRIRSSSLSMIAGLLPLTRLLRQNHHDISLSFVSNAIAFHYLAQRLSRTKSPFVPCVQNHFSSESSNANWFGRYVVYPTAKSSLTAAPGIICISHGVKADLISHLPLDGKPIEVINNIGYDSDVNERLKNAAPVALASGCVNLIACGRLHPQKDYPTLLKAVQIASQSASIHLSILGKGSLEEMLRAECKNLGIVDKVTFLGFVDNPYAYIANADIFVLSSLWEGFGNVIVEAMTCGTPVIATDCPHGPAEILDNGRYGKLVPTADAPALAAAITTLASSPEERARLVSIAFERIQTYSPQRIAGQYAGNLQQLFDHSR